MRVWDGGLPETARTFPEAGPGRAVVDVEYAGVTFVETQVRAARPPFTPPELPLIPGNGVGGTVRDVGEGVDRALIGRSVVSTTGGRGGYAGPSASNATAHLAP